MPPCTHMRPTPAAATAKNQTTNSSAVTSCQRDKSGIFSRPRIFKATFGSLLESRRLSTKYRTIIETTARRQNFFLVVEAAGGVYLVSYLVPTNAQVVAILNPKHSLSFTELLSRGSESHLAVPFAGERIGLRRSRTEPP